MPIRGEPLGYGVHPVEPASQRRQPKGPVGILLDVVNPVIRQSLVIKRLVVVDFDFMPVVAIQAVLRGNPQEAMLVLMEIMDGSLGQAVFEFEVFEAG
jgi:hypothetical protein